MDLKRNPFHCQVLKNPFDQCVSSLRISFLLALCSLKSLSLNGPFDHFTSMTILNRAQLINWLADTLGRYWPITDILVLAYILSNMAY